MADRRPKVATVVADAAPPRPQALTGSAQILKASRVNAPKNVAWQTEAWQHWRNQPEPSFAANWVGHAFSRCRLFIARRPQAPGDEPEPVTDGPAVDLLSQLGGGVLGQQALLHSFGVHMTVPGVGYLTGRQAIGAFDSWQVLSADEIRVKGKGYEVQVDEQTWEPTPPHTLVCKCWRPDEQFHWRPWSPMQPCLPVLRELDGLSKKIDADIVSRLASAGIILIPSEVEFPVRPEFANADDPFMAEIIEVVSTAIRDRASAAANVPVFIRIPGEYVDKIKHLTWTTALDAIAIDLRKEARGRFAVGMDMPAEVLTGMGDINHWGAWERGEAGVVYHIKPGMEAIVQGITIGFLQPGLDALRASDPDLLVWFDTSELTSRPNLAETTTAAYDRFEVSPRALRRESGIDESDAPTPDELRIMVVKKALADPRLLSDPALAAALFEEVGIVLPTVTPAEVPGQPVPGPSPAPLELPAAPNSPPAAPADVNPPPPSAALVAAADGFVIRALERAGNRLLRKKNGPIRNELQEACPPLTAHVCLGGLVASGIDVNVSFLMDGAWDRVPEVADRLEVDAVWLSQSLELYTAGLLESGRAHTWGDLESFLAAESLVAS